MTRSPRTARRLATTAVALLLLTGSAACGASSGSDAADDPTTTVAPGGDDDGTTTTPDDGGDETTTTEATTDTTEGGGGGGGDEQAYVDALVSTFDEDDGEAFSTEQVECLATEWVGTVGVGRFEDAGVTPEDIRADDGDFDDLDIDEGTAQEMVGAFDTCDVDLVGLFKESLGSEDLTTEQAACIDDLLTEEAIRDSFVADIVGDDSVEDPLDDLGSCLGFGSDDLDDAADDTPAAEPVTPSTVG